MAEVDVLERRALHHRDRVAKPTLRRPGHGVGQLPRNDDCPPIHFVGPIVEIGMEGDRQIRRDRPGGRRPDEDGNRAVGQHGDACRQLAHARGVERELDVDRRRRVVLVLDLGFGQRRPAVKTPVNGLLALVDDSPLDEPAQGPGDRRLITVVHRQVGLGPRTEDPQPLEVMALAGDELRRVGTACPAEISHRQAGLFRAELAVDFELDRKAVTVPAGHIRRVEPGHRARLDDEILEDLVERVPDVDVAVGVGGAVVEDEPARASAARANPVIQPVATPARDDLRLGRRQVGPHRKFRAGQVHGVLPLGHMEGPL